MCIRDRVLLVLVLVLVPVLLLVLVLSGVVMRNRAKVKRAPHALASVTRPFAPARIAVAGSHGPNPPFTVFTPHAPAIACSLAIPALLSVEKIARSFLSEFTDTLNKGQDAKWTGELSKVRDRATPYPLKKKSSGGWLKVKL